MPLLTAVCNSTAVNNIDNQNENLGIIWTLMQNNPAFTLISDNDPALDSNIKREIIVQYGNCPHYLNVKGYVNNTGYVQFDIRNLANTARIEYSSTHFNMAGKTIVFNYNEKGFLLSLETNKIALGSILSNGDYCLLSAVNFTTNPTCHLAGDGDSLNNKIDTTGCPFYKRFSDDAFIIRQSHIVNTSLNLVYDFWPLFVRLIKNVTNGWYTETGTGRKYYVTSNSIRGDSNEALIIG